MITDEQLPANVRFTEWLSPALATARFARSLPDGRGFNALDAEIVEA
ncbi:hypothetical protein KKHFBJBL_00302 [Brevundimonas sp. NIBR11]|nr:hypothetical protein KKHFBJBL_00302 [Brevundimonas sp. NIBR11]